MPKKNSQYSSAYKRAEKVAGTALKFMDAHAADVIGNAAGNTATSSMGRRGTQGVLEDVIEDLARTTINKVVSNAKKKKSRSGK